MLHTSHTGPESPVPAQDPTPDPTPTRDQILAPATRTNSTTTEATTGSDGTDASIPVQPGLKSFAGAARILRAYPLPVLAFALLLASLVLWLAGQRDMARWPMLVVIVLGGVPLCWETLLQIIHGELSVDVIAILAIVGSLLLGQYLAGALVVLMLSGGEALEAYALQRAQSSLAALAERSPRWAHIRHEGQLETISADAVQVGTEIVVKPGELIPVDGIVIGGASNVSEADLTGEPMPVRKELGAEVLSGSVNLDGVLDVRAVCPAAESHYAQIVRLVADAQKSKAPIHRLADRYAVWFTAFSLALAALAWALSGDSLDALAVLVVATPCPLILATPIAIMSGMNQAAKMGFIVKSGAVMEQLGEVDVAVFDKTGTLTLGEPQLVDVRLADEAGAVLTDTRLADPEAAEVTWDLASSEPRMGRSYSRALLQLVASVEQFSGHILARAVVKAAVERGIPLLAATHVEEVLGKGVHARVAAVSGAHDIDESDASLALEDNVPAMTGASAESANSRPTAIAVGNRTFLRSLDIPIPEHLTAERARLAEGGKLASFVAIDGRVAALLIFADTPRPDVARLSPALHALGIVQTMLLTGDGETVAKQVGSLAAMDRVVAQCLPEDKVKVVAELHAQGRRVLMVGDGVNDAPALALATVGVAVGVQGLNASAAVADAVLVSANIMQIAAAVRLGQHVLHIAKQGIWIGIGLSVVAMIFASAGFIPPAVGAILQEGIDVLVILNALRAGRPAPTVP